MKTTLAIQNLKCSGCASSITKKLSELPQITAIEVFVDEGAVRFDYENESALQEVKDCLKQIGYPVDGEANSLGTKAKSYVSCAIGKIS